ncbi:hypothetical protein [Dokdonella soli]
MIRPDKAKAGSALAVLVWMGGLLACGNAEAIYRPTPTAVAAGAYHSCVLWNTGGVSCWGNNYYSQLGNPNAGINSNTMWYVTGLQATVKQVVAGDWFTCALLTTGGVQCWGNNGYGELGVAPGGVYSTPVAVPGFGSSHPIVQLAAGGSHVCALDSTSHLYCWGSNVNLQLGYTPNGFTSQPQLVSLPATPVSITAGEAMSCAVTSSSFYAQFNQMYCWGNIGGGTQYWGDNNSTPTLINNNLANFYPVSISAGVDTVCAYGGYSLFGNGGGVTGCFGGNDYGQLGAGVAVYYDSYDLSPLSPHSGSTALSGVNVLATGPARNVNCANVPNKGLYCWGKNDYGQLGDYKNENVANTAQLIVSAPWSALSVAAGDRHTCAVLTYPNYGNYLYCWGYNQDGELGDGTYTERDWPVRIW